MAKKYSPPPEKPKSMSQKRYRELHDSTPTVVEVKGARFKCAGPVSAEVLANDYRSKGENVTVRYAD
jgi:hypothetical protein